MEEKIYSEGKCLFCGKIFAKEVINSHLNDHINEIANTGKAGKSFLVKVVNCKSIDAVEQLLALPGVVTNKIYDNNDAAPYFLNFWIDGATKLEEIDGVLRNIWLDCCGHNSAFYDPKRKSASRGKYDVADAYEFLRFGDVAKYEKIMKDIVGEIPMRHRSKKIFYRGLTLDYEYDFGSSTFLTLEVVEEYPVKAKKRIVFLSRNEPLQIMCSLCNKVPATQVCAIDAHVFCDKCAKKHAKKCFDFAEYASMPVVNSPRMGVCGYEGGSIDKERDGIYCRHYDSPMNELNQ